MPDLHLILATSLVLSILFSEISGFSAAGLIVPGYFAFYLFHPWMLFMLVFAAVLTLVTEKAIARFTLLFGRRLLAMDLLLSFFYVHLLTLVINRLLLGPENITLDAISYFIPALAVIFIGANGYLSTIGSLILLTASTRIIAEWLIFRP